MRRLLPGLQGARVEQGGHQWPGGWKQGWEGSAASWGARITQDATTRAIFNGVERKIDLPKVCIVRTQDAPVK